MPDILPVTLRRSKFFMKKKTVFYIIFFVLLVVAFYFGLKQFIPGFADEKLPVLSYVQPFSFINQNGQPVTEKNTAGKVYIAEYFFTTCKGICPKMNTNMKKLYDDFKKEKDFLILSHTVDPQTDTVARMKRYADSIGVNTNNWWFLTGKKDSLYLAARISYLLDDPKNGNDKIEDQFIHTQFFALVDKNGRVRKIYDGLKKEELEELATDISKLLNEKVTGTTFVNSIFSNNPN
jgi:protein SCO1